MVNKHKRLQRSYDENSQIRHEMSVKERTGKHLRGK